MLGRGNKNWYTIAGCLALAAGIAVRQFVHGNLADSGAGALTGVAIGLLIVALGVCRRANGPTTAARARYE